MPVSVPQAHALLLRAVEQEFPILVTTRISEARRFRRDEDFPSIQELIDDPSDANISANKTLQDGVSFENEGGSAPSASSGGAGAGAGNLCGRPATPTCDNRGKFDKLGHNKSTAVQQPRYELDEVTKATSNMNIGSSSSASNSFIDNTGRRAGTTGAGYVYNAGLFG